MKHTCVASTSWMKYICGLVSIRTESFRYYVVQCAILRLHILEKSCKISFDYISTPRKWPRPKSGVFPFLDDKINWSIQKCTWLVQIAHFVPAECPNFSIHEKQFWNKRQIVVIAFETRVAQFLGRTWYLVLLVIVSPARGKF